MDQQKIGQFIQALRKERNLTQKELADSIGVSDKTISKWENGNGLPDIGSLQALSTYFGVTVNEILAGEKLPPADYQEQAEATILTLLGGDKKRKSFQIAQGLLGIVLLALGILFLCVLNFGITFAGSLRTYFDFGSLLPLLLICGSSLLLSKAHSAHEVWKILRRVTLPAGLAISLFHLVNVLLAGQSDEGFLFQCGLCLLPLFYATLLSLPCATLEVRSRIQGH